MHIADGFLTTPVVAVTAVSATVGIALASRRVARDGVDVAAVGMMAAFLFVAQMVNFPLPGVGASWHVLGAGLAVIALGAAPAVLAMGVVVLIQALFFADGGVSALGANITSMALAGPLAAACALALFKKNGALAWFCAAAAATCASAGFCAVALLASGTLPLKATPLFLFAGIHLLVAVFEGVVTAAVAIAMKRHGKAPATAPAASRGVRVLAAAALAFLLAAPFVYMWTEVKLGIEHDGMEYVVEHHGEELESPAWAAWAEKMWFAEYEFPGVPAPYGTWLVAATGALAAFGAAFWIARGMVKNREK